MQTIDGHHHMWDMQACSYPWLEDENNDGGFMGNIASLKRNYTLPDYLADAAACDLVKSVHVQAEHNDADPVAETRWLQEVANHNPGGFPHGIVAFADFSRPDVGAILSAHAQYANVRGIRQILSHHPDPAYAHAPREYLEESQWRDRFSNLRKYGLSFDLQLYPHQVESALPLLDANPDIPIILNHCGEPWDHSTAGKTQWRHAMQQLSKREQVSVKISGLGMFVRPPSADGIREYVLTLIDLFGTDRAMFASNFPVDKLYASFADVFSAFLAVTGDFSPAEQSALLHDNAKRIYRL